MWGSLHASGQQSGHVQNLGSPHDKHMTATGDGSYWHKADMDELLLDVCFRGVKRTSPKRAACRLMTQSGHRRGLPTSPSEPIRCAFERGPS